MPARPSLFLRLLFAAVLGCASPAVWALFAVTEPWLRPANAQASTEVYALLMSSDGATLVEVRSPIAAQVSLLRADGRPMAPAGLTLPPGETVKLAPGHIRVRLARVAKALQLGDRVPLTLVLRSSAGKIEEIAVDAEVRHRSPTDDHRLPHQHPPLPPATR